MCRGTSKINNKLKGIHKAKAEIGEISGRGG